MDKKSLLICACCAPGKTGGAVGCMVLIVSEKEEEFGFGRAEQRRVLLATRPRAAILRARVASGGEFYASLRLSWLSVPFLNGMANRLFGKKVRIIATPMHELH